MSEDTKELVRKCRRGRTMHNGDPEVLALCDAYEALEAEHEAFMEVAQTNHRELRRLEGLLRAWGSARKAKTPGHVSNEVFWAEDAVYAEAVRLAREPHP